MKEGHKITLIAKLMMLMILSAGCRNLDPNSYPRLDIQEQLSPAFAYIEINGVKYIDMNKSRCLSRLYRVDREMVGPVNQEVFILPIEECNRMIGYAPSEYGSFATWLESMRKWLLAWL